MNRHSVRINDIVTSVMLEDEYWDELKELCAVKEMRVSEFLTILARGEPNNLASAIRTEILHAKNLEIANLRKMIGAVAKTALDGITQQPAGRVRAVR